MHLFLDTNILLDIIEARPEFVENSTQVLARAEEINARIFIAWHGLATIYYLIPKADRFWTFGKWRGSVRSRGARPPRVPSVAPRDRHGEVRVATCWFFQSPREGAWRCARGRARSPRRSRKDRYSTVHNLGAFGITLAPLCAPWRPSRLCGKALCKMRARCPRSL